MHSSLTLNADIAPSGPFSLRWISVSTLTDGVISRRKPGSSEEIAIGLS